MTARVGNYMTLIMHIVGNYLTADTALIMSKQAVPRHLSDIKSH